MEWVYHCGLLHRSPSLLMLQKLCPLKQADYMKIQLYAHCIFPTVYFDKQYSVISHLPMHSQNHVIPSPGMELQILKSLTVRSSTCQNPLYCSLPIFCTKTAYSKFCMVTGRCTRLVLVPVTAVPHCLPSNRNIHKINFYSRYTCILAEYLDVVII